MQAVHEDIRFRNIGIWYDEFLETGYDFSEEIKRAIRDSRMFAMVVTPNILTNGGYNYVKEQEYPLAASLGKPVLPVEFVKTDYAKLKEEYKGISAPVSSCDKYGFCHALESVFPGGGPTKKMADPKHQFLLGLAYLGGIGLEKNTEYAVSLITAAAEVGHPQAIERLVTMYEYGEAVERNMSAAIVWQEQLVRCYREDYEKSGLQESGIRTVFGQHRLYGYLTEAGREREALGISIQMKKLSSELRKKRPRDYSSIECLVISLSDVADALYRLGDIKDAEKIRLSLQILNKILAQDTGLPDADEDLIINYQHLGSISEEKNDFKSALKYYQKSLQISGKMKENNGTDAVYRRWLNDLYRVGRCYLELGRMEEAENYLQKCLKGYQSFSSAAESNLWNIYFALGSVSCQRLELDHALHYCDICLQLAEREEGLEGQRRLADSYARKSDVLKAEKHYKDAEFCYRKALELMECIFKETGEEEDQDRLWHTYGMLGDCYLETGQIREAKRYYQKSLQDITLLSERNSIWKNRLGLAQGYQRMGMVTYREGAPALAENCFKKALAIVKKVEKNAQIQMCGG